MVYAAGLVTAFECDVYEAIILCHVGNLRGRVVCVEGVHVSVGDNRVVGIEDDGGLVADGRAVGRIRLVLDDERDKSLTYAVVVIRQEEAVHDVFQFIAVLLKRDKCPVGNASLSVELSADAHQDIMSVDLIFYVACKFLGVAASHSI